MGLTQQELWAKIRQARGSDEAGGRAEQKTPAASQLSRFENPKGSKAALSIDALVVLYRLISVRLDAPERERFVTLTWELMGVWLERGEAPVPDRAGRWPPLVAVPGPEIPVALPEWRRWLEQGRQKSRLVDHRGALRAYAAARDLGAGKREVVAWALAERARGLRGLNQYTQQEQATAEALYWLTGGELQPEIGVSAKRIEVQMRGNEVAVLAFAAACREAAHVRLGKDNYEEASRAILSMANALEVMPDPEMLTELEHLRGVWAYHWGRREEKNLARFETARDGEALALACKHFDAAEQAPMGQDPAFLVHSARHRAKCAFLLRDKHAYHQAARQAGRASEGHLARVSWVADEARMEVARGNYGKAEGMLVEGVGISFEIESKDVMSNLLAARGAVLCTKPKPEYAEAARQLAGALLVCPTGEASARFQRLAAYYRDTVMLLDEPLKPVKAVAQSMTRYPFPLVRQMPDWTADRVERVDRAVLARRAAPAA